MAVGEIKEVAADVDVDEVEAVAEVAGEVGTGIRRETVVVEVVEVGRMRKRAGRSRQGRRGKGRWNLMGDRMLV